MTNITPLRDYLQHEPPLRVDEIEVEYVGGNVLVTFNPSSKPVRISMSTGVCTKMMTTATEAMNANLSAVLSDIRG
ncbi:MULTISPECIES: hypothetical protein [unclassified Bradyrhizobium]|uniref:hypothetical protein n=1 Tax=unclassified Bradyrhizobium TaxID=2631580 RepID=UPI0004166934|nr:MULTISPECIES: hypothetical protein [unclassified Bradyrhizobium]MCP3466603.1 hypothetical protein [Bradyrhizobium sp. CCGUVB23]